MFFSSPVASFAVGTIAANVVSLNWCITTTQTYCGLSSGEAACILVSTPGISGATSVTYSSPTQGICRHSNFPWFTGRVFASCPPNSTGTTTCTCNTDYMPDPTGTSCIPAKYTISLTGASTTKPSAVLPLNATVKDQNGVVQAGKQVIIGNCQVSCRLTACDYAAIFSSTYSSFNPSFSTRC